jgi:hypothetical protein
LLDFVFLLITQHFGITLLKTPSNIRTTNVSRADVESSEVKSISQLQDSRADVESSEVKSTSQLQDSKADVESSEVKSTGFQGRCRINRQK